MTISVQSPHAEAVQRWAAFYDNPNGFVRDIIGASPDPWQEDALNDVRDICAGRHPGMNGVAVRSCHGPGKTTLLAWAGLWFLSTRSFARIPCTHPNMRQLKKTLWPEFAKWIRMSKGLDTWLEWSKENVTLRGSPELGAEWFITARTSKSPESLQGFHSGNLLFLVDEASGIDDMMWAPVYGALTSKEAHAAILMTSNPIRLSGEFYRAFHQDKNLWIRHKIGYKDSPRVDLGWVARMEARWGVDSPYFQARVLAEFPQVADLILYPRTWLRKARERASDGHVVATKPHILGVDVARTGSAKTAFALWKGDLLCGVESFSKWDTMKTSDYIKAKHREYGLNLMVVDETGVGAGVVDDLRRSGYAPIGFISGAKPLSKKGKTLFANLKAEAAWRLRDRLEAGVVGLDCDDETIEDLEGLEYSLDRRGRIRVIDTDDLTATRLRERGIEAPPSPDKAHATIFGHHGVMLTLRGIGADVPYEEDERPDLERDILAGVGAGGSFDVWDDEQGMDWIEGRDEVY